MQPSVTIQIIIALVCVGAIVLVLTYIQELGLEECQIVTPPTYELTGHYVLGFQLTCFYETLPQYKYHYCQKTFSKTQNHGKILSRNTCKGGL